jgi:hypothetical protein
MAKRLRDVCKLREIDGFFHKGRKANESETLYQNVP